MGRRTIRRRDEVGRPSVNARGTDGVGTLTDYGSYQMYKLIKERGMDPKDREEVVAFVKEVYPVWKGTYEDLKF